MLENRHCSTRSSEWNSAFFKALFHACDFLVWFKIIFKNFRKGQLAADLEGLTDDLNCLKDLRNVFCAEGTFFLSRFFYFFTKPFEHFSVFGLNFVVKTNNRRWSTRSSSRPAPWMPTAAPVLVSSFRNFDAGFMRLVGTLLGGEPLRRFRRVEQNKNNLFNQTYKNNTSSTNIFCRNYY